MITHSAAISARAKDWRRRWLCAQELREDVRSQLLQPNVVTYSAAISACERIYDGGGCLLEST